jgi:sortase A
MFVTGGALAVWCLLVVVRAGYYSRLPVPPAQRTLPDESAAASPAPSLKTGAWIARLEAPSIQLAATVLEGSDDATLMRAAGHIEETALPGRPGNIGIAGHRDTIFRPLRHAKVGDELTLTTPDRVFRYRISETRIVGPKDVYVLDPTPRPAMTLVTCYPFEFIGHAPKRFIVRADLLREEVRSEGAGRAGAAGRTGAD